ncbi:hypothetical protein [Oleiagrimonas sp. MCCC 1A03011]|uniref:hypothetical protein n=1 Tax=Oleiagrimonas sp. MCCC 1A03011 TaxID=1926883 RepID=UPI0011BF6B26|nr:hypothetical protein [Oleiagrimonas sp. MCCC 1A03011]
MKTVLTRYPDSADHRGYLQVTAVTYNSADHKCQISVRLGAKGYLIVFPDTVAFRVMDEREMPEFYSNNIEYANALPGSLVCRVDAGGWRGQSTHLDSGIRDGFFGKGAVAEYVVASDYACLNIISAAPTISEIIDGA